MANHLFSGFDLGRLAHVQPHTGIEFEGIATSGGFRIPEDHANFGTELVDENKNRVGF